MVLTGTITKQGGKAKSVKVTATVTADKGDAGIKVVSSSRPSSKGWKASTRPD